MGRSKQLLDDIKEEFNSWKLKEEAINNTLRRTSCGRGCGLVVRQTTK
jgi:hypothetical protein